MRSIFWTCKIEARVFLGVWNNFFKGLKYDFLEFEIRHNQGSSKVIINHSNFLETLDMEANDNEKKKKKKFY